MTHIDTCLSDGLHVTVVFAVCVQNATINGASHGSTVDESTNITCIADTNAYPPAQYRWKNSVDGDQATGSQFVLQPGTEYKLTCTASNNFDRGGCHATAYIEVNSKLSLYLQGGPNCTTDLLLCPIKTC